MTFVSNMSNTSKTVSLDLQTPGIWLNKGNAVDFFYVTQENNESSFDNSQHLFSKPSSRKWIPLFVLREMLMNFRRLLTKDLFSSVAEVLALLGIRQLRADRLLSECKLHTVQSLDDLSQKVCCSLPTRELFYHSLHPVGNHSWSLQSDWPWVMWFIPTNENVAPKQKNQSDLEDHSK